MAEPVALKYRAFISYSHADTAQPSGCIAARELSASTRTWSDARRQPGHPESAAAHLPRSRRFHRRSRADRPDARRARCHQALDRYLLSGLGQKSLRQRGNRTLQIAPSRAARDPADCRRQARRSRARMLPAGAEVQARRGWAGSPKSRSSCLRPTCARKATASPSRSPKSSPACSVCPQTISSAAPSASARQGQQCGSPALRRSALLAGLAVWAESTAAMPGSSSRPTKRSPDRHARIAATEIVDIAQVSARPREYGVPRDRHATRFLGTKPRGLSTTWR